MYGFEYLRSEGDPKNGQYPDGEEYDVNLVYKVTLPYSVTARYVDEAGNPLCENIIYRGATTLPPIVLSIGVFIFVYIY